MEEQDYSESTNTGGENSQNEPNYKRAEVTSNGRLKGSFVPGNIANLSNHKLSKAEVSLLDQSILKEDLEKFGKTLKLEWHYINDERNFDPNPFLPKSKFNPCKTDAAI